MLNVRAQPKHETKFGQTLNLRFCQTSIQNKCGGYQLRRCPDEPGNHFALEFCVCTTYINMNIFQYASGGFNSWLFDPCHGGNRSTKPYLGTYLTSLSTYDSVKNTKKVMNFSPLLYLNYLRSITYEKDRSIRNL